MTEMDDSFASFYHEEGFGPALWQRAVPDETIARFRTKLPDQLLSYWRQHGWAAYGRGLFWFVDPDEYEPVLEAWLGDTPLVEKDAYYIIARSAFGDLYLWGTRSGQSLVIKSVWGKIFPRDNTEKVAAGGSDRLVRSFVELLTKQRLDLKDHLDQPLFERALQALGPLEAGETYGFEPALAITGRPDIKDLRRLTAVDHLVLLAQLGEREVMQDVVQLARERGI